MKLKDLTQGKHIFFTDGKFPIHHGTVAGVTSDEVIVDERRIVLLKPGIKDRVLGTYNHIIVEIFDDRKEALKICYKHRIDSFMDEIKRNTSLAGIDDLIYLDDKLTDIILHFEGINL